VQLKSAQEKKRKKMDASCLGTDNNVNKQKLLQQVYLKVKRDTSL